MAKNLEFKAAVESFETLTGRLTELKAVYQETVHQIDTYFHVPIPEESIAPRLKLREVQGMGWLIYYERPNRKSSRYSNYQLCAVADPVGLKSVLTLALQVKTVVEKHRDIWMFQRTRIHLDRVAALGEFIELETVFQGQTEAEAIAEHQHVKTVLRLDATDPIAVSYSDLVIAKP